MDLFINFGFALVVGMNSFLAARAFTGNFDGSFSLACLGFAFVLAMRTRK